MIIKLTSGAAHLDVGVQIRNVSLAAAAAGYGQDALQKTQYVSKRKLSTIDI
jgi:hypothetical protein